MACLTNLGNMAGILNQDFLTNLRTQLELITPPIPTTTLDTIISNTPNLITSNTIENSLNLNQVRNTIDTKNISAKVLSANAPTTQEVYDPQNQLEGFKVPEVVVDSKVNTTDLKPIEYKPFRKQNIIKTVIDKISNLYQVNKEKFSIQWLHYKSKSYVKIDKDGNVTMYIKGNFKQVIEGDYHLEVRGNKQEKVFNDYYIDIEGKQEINITKDLNIKVGTNTTLDSTSGILFKNKFTIEDKTTITSSLTVGAKITSSGNIVSGGNLVASGNLAVGGIAKASAHI